MKLGSHTSATYASDMLGTQEVIEHVDQDNGRSHNVKMRPNVLAGELRGLKKPSWKHDRLEGFAEVFGDPGAKFECTFRDDVTVEDDPFNAKALRPASHQDLPRLSPSDLGRLGIRVTSEIMDAL